MLGDSKAFSGFAVDDLAAAKRFYGETLGVKVKDFEAGPMEMLELEIPGRNTIIVYPKETHNPAEYTILNFPVDDVEATVAGLKERGVEFERYEGTEMETGEDGIFRGGGPLIAWFTDPAGNVLSVIGDSPS